MMSCDCDTANPLQRDGTSQGQRLPDALKPAYVAVDERKLEDLMVFALDFAGQIRYFNTENSAEDEKDWAVFLERDVTTILSQISRKNIQPVRDTFNSLFNALEAAPDIDKLRALWAPCLEMLSLADKWYGNCDERFALRKSLQLYFNSVFLPNYTRLLGIDLGAEDVLDEKLNVTVVDLESPWAEELPEGTDKVTNIFIGDNDGQKIRSAANYVKNIFEQNYNSVLSLIAKAPSFLTESMEAFPYHKAHTGLFIAFLRIFAYLQESLNEMTERHLEFYFGEILQLAQRDAEPDEVHVIFELAKNVASSYELDKGTALNAGKDKNKVPILFNTDDTLVINKAQAVLFKNVLVEKNTGAADTYVSVYAAPEANTADGEGAELDKDIPQWNAFGEFQHGLDTPTMPEARAGFAFASPQLVLGEGTRTITLSVELGGSAIGAALDSIRDVNADNNADELNSYFSVSLTGAKKWFDVTSPSVKVVKSGSTYTLQVVATLGSGDPAIAAYSSDAHAEKLDIPASWPVIYVQLIHKKITEGSTEYASILYAAFQDTKVAQATIKAEVGGVKTFFVQGGQSTFDPAKPFEAFGSDPSINTSLIIGTEEIFYKKIDSLTMQVEWADVKNDSFDTYYQPYEDVGVSGAARANADFTARLEYLEEGKWIKDLVTVSGEQVTATYTDVTSGAAGNSTQTFTTTDKTVNFYLFDSDATHIQAVRFARNGNKPLFHADRASAFDTLEPYGTASQRGFIRLNLSGKDFLHGQYAEGLMRAALKTAAAGNATINPNSLVYTVPPPYTPKVKSLTLSYVSTQELDAETDEFFVIHPFGYASEELSDTNPPSLLPQFEIEVTDELDENLTTTSEQSAMFYIGLEKAEPGLSISMLVQVVEDSGNPDIVVPDINWSYLSNNTWIRLDQSQVLKDTTNGFITSGIVKLALPDDATNDNTILPSGYHWYCASVENNSDALCKLLSVQTQAVKATFTDNGNDLSRLSVPLEEGTVKKLDTPVGEIKKIKQPYASFSGRTKEEGNDYYRRVSERLRHKQRAVTIWDYERLVLEKFPSIYKTKCINHTANKLAVEGCYYELAPGHVCLIVVSNLRNQNQVNPLQPSTSIGTRTEIKKYLQKHCSRFVQLEVINPNYEEIQVSFGVKFLAEFDADKGYYRTKLIDDIKQFLSPWAYDEGADIVFGGKIHQSYIIDFIEEREYVDYVDKFKLYKLDAPDVFLESVSASNAKSVLVSAETHLLTDVNENPL